MRIWMPTIETGTGAQVYAERLAAGLRGRGHDVRLDLYRHAYQYGPWFIPGAPPADCDVIIANSWNASVFARHGLPLITIMHHVVHDADLAPYKTFAQKQFHAWFVKPMEKAALAASDATVCVSETTAERTRQAFGPYATRTILNAIDTDFYTPAPFPPEGDRPLRLLFVGKPSRRKGFATVAALRIALGARAELVMVGSAPEPGLPQIDAERLGKVSDERLREEYRKADFLLLPSRVEGFGYVAAEAMACGLPVACLPGGAVEEVVQPPACGVLLDPEDAEGSARSLIAARDDGEGMAAMRKAARERAARCFAIPRWLDEFEALLAEVTTRN